MASRNIPAHTASAAPRERPRLSRSQMALLRQIPAVSALLEHPAMAAALSRHDRKAAHDEVEFMLAEYRYAVLRGCEIDELPNLAELARQAVCRLDTCARTSMRRAINATGIVLHTGLGRSVIPLTACLELRDLSSHLLLEVDPQTGKRGDRQDHLSGMLCRLTGAPAAAVVNNCAAAVVLAIAALAHGKEVILSRGQMVEIGGSFRMPDIIRAAGARLVEVGSTNRTRISDYKRAVSQNTALILWCHPSNYEVVGFTEEASAAQLVALGREHGIPVMEDQGSGAIIDPAELGLSPRHGSLPASVKLGYSVITASADKLLGGNQAGVVLGSVEIIEKMMAHPLARAMRPDKLTLHVLQSTLRAYMHRDVALAHIPTLVSLTRTAEELQSMAADLKRRMRRGMPAGRFQLSLRPDVSHAGGGSLPGDDLPTTCVAIRCIDGSYTCDSLARAFRLADPAVIGRIQDDALLFDPRTMLEHEIGVIASIATTVASQASEEPRPAARHAIAGRDPARKGRLQP